MYDADTFNQAAAGCLPGYLGLRITHIANGEVHAEMPVQSSLMAPNGFLHAGSLVTLADSAAGCGCMAHLPPGASGFTTVELKSNHLGTAREGTVECVSKATHRGKTTQVWDSVVTHRETGKTLVLFRCTQMILYPKAA